MITARFPKALKIKNVTAVEPEAITRAIISWNGDVYHRKNRNE